MQEIFFLFLLILSLQVSASEDKKASIFETDISRISGVSSRSFKGKEIKITTITIGADTDKISNRFLVMGGLEFPRISGQSLLNSLVNFFKLHRTHIVKS